MISSARSLASKFKLEEASPASQALNTTGLNCLQMAAKSPSKLDKSDWATVALMTLKKGLYCAFHYSYLSPMREFLRALVLDLGQDTTT